MLLHLLEDSFSVCQIKDISDLPLHAPSLFFAKTAAEISLVCPSPYVPVNALACEPGWKAFYVDGQLDFSLTGILSRLSGLLAKADIPIFALSTYLTDYILVKENHLSSAVTILERNGYSFV